MFLITQTSQKLGVELFKILDFTDFEAEVTGDICLEWWMLGLEEALKGIGPTVATENRLLGNYSCTSS